MAAMAEILRGLIGRQLLALPRPDAVRAIRPTMPVPTERADTYRAARLWDDRRLGDGLELAVARRPRAIAIADNDRRLTYEDLSRWVHSGVRLLIDYLIHHEKTV